MFYLANDSCHTVFRITTCVVYSVMTKENGLHLAVKLAFPEENASKPFSCIMQEIKI